MAKSKVLRSSEGFYIKKPGRFYFGISRIDGSFSCGFLDFRGGLPEKEWDFTKATWLDILVLYGLTKECVEHAMTMDAIAAGKYLDQNC